MVTSKLKVKEDELIGKNLKNNIERIAKKMKRPYGYWCFN